MNGIICVNKPKDMTSFDVVYRIRKIFNNKVGHNGTLDPMASGVLVLAIGTATKALPYLNIDDKTYIASVKLGFETSTGDIWGDSIKEKEIEKTFEDIDIYSICNSFIGPMRQRVPKVSAKRIDGKKSYEYVFDNKPVKQLYTDIEIYDIEILDIQKTTLTFKAHVSKGTYIRTLCEDIAHAIGELGTMSSLERIAVGDFTIKDCYNLEDINIDTPLLSVKEKIGIPTITKHSLEENIKHGKRISLDTIHDLVFLDGGSYYAVYQREKESIFKSIRGLW